MAYDLNPFTGTFDDKGKSTATLDARYLVQSNNLSDLDNTVTARSNLGLGSLAVENTNTTALTQYLPLSGGTMTGAVDFNYQGIQKLYQNIITVSALGGADYTTMEAAIASITDAAVDNQYAIYIYPGTYIATADQTVAQYIHFIGVDPALVTLRAKASSRGPAYTFSGNNNLANITFRDNAVGWTYELLYYNGGTISNCNLEMLDCTENVTHTVLTITNSATALTTFQNTRIFTKTAGAGGANRIIYAINNLETSLQFYFYNSLINMATSGTASTYGISASGTVGHAISGSTIITSKAGTGTFNRAVWASGGILTTTGSILIGATGPGGGAVPPNLGHGAFNAQTAGAVALQGTGQNVFIADAAATVATIIKGAASQTAAVHQDLDSSNNVHNETYVAHASNVYTNVFNEQGSPNLDFRVEGDTDANLLFADASADTVQVGAATASDSAKFYVSGKISTSGEVEINGDLNHDGSNLGFFGTAPTTQQTELTDELTTITFTAPGTPDYAIQDFTQTTPWGFASQDEANTVLSVVANLQTRVNELETKLAAYGLLADAD